MKMMLPITLIAGITLGILAKPHIQPPTYVSVAFEDNHYIVEPPKNDPIMPVAQVQAQEPELTPIEVKIWEVFGEDAPTAIKVATCESGMRAEAHGDTALLVVNGKDIVGDSIGVFQIRTGGKDFNRARANNMTPDEFRAWMWDADENIKYAKEIYDRQGWAPWTCKKDL